jgi:hypothetical protein
MSSKKVTKEVTITVGNPLTVETRKLEGIRTWNVDYLIDVKTDEVEFRENIRRPKEL